MPRGLDQKIFWPIREGREDEDEEKFNEYLELIKVAKENKGIEFFVLENAKNENKVKGRYIVLLDKKVDKDKAIEKNYKKFL